MLDRLPTAILQSIFWIMWSDLQYLLINKQIKQQLWSLYLQYYQWGRECKIPLEAQYIRTCNPNHLNQYRRRISWRKRKWNDTIQSFPVSIPLPHLHHLELEVDMDQPLPNSLHTLHLYNCSKPITVDFPSALTSLSFGVDFNQPIQVSFPDSLKRLKFGHCFNQLFLFPLPHNLVTLRFGHNFNQPLVGVPDTLESLIFDPYGKFNQALPRLPNLTKLWISRAHVEPISYPTSLIQLSLNEHVNPSHLPFLPFLQVLQTKEWSIEFNERFPVLHTLILYSTNNFILSTFPTTLTTLSLTKTTLSLPKTASHIMENIMETLPQLCQLKLGHHLYGIDRKGPKLYSIKQ